MAKDFIHLHTHSHYSLLDGLSKIKDLVKTAQKYNMKAIALTDHGNMHGAIEFYKACKAVDIKPIIGVEAYVSNRGRMDKEPGIDNKRYHLTLLAKNETGYKNIMKLVTLSHLEGFYYKPRIDKEIMRKYNQGIICLSGCPAGELANALRAQNMDKAREVIREHQEIYGQENYFLELMNHPSVEGSEVVKKGIIDLSKEFNIPIVATWDSHYLHQDDREAHDTLLAINTNSDDKSKKFTLGEEDYSFINPDQAYENFKDMPEILENTLKVADLCDLKLDLGKWLFPDYKITSGLSADEELKNKTFEGLEKRGVKKTPEVLERVEYELEVIKNKGYSPYFLVVSDLLLFTRENNIFSTTRGSAAGSMVSYLNFITTVNPISYGLPFERFLNPKRPSAPDIDMDIADNRRDEVIEYAKKKYGIDKVAQIGTFGTMMARGSVRDVARALGYPYQTGDRISKMIPMGSQGFPMTIEKAMEIVPEIQKMYDEESDVRKIIDMAKKLEGSVRHVSVHAAGVVIAPTELTDFVPLQLDPKGGKIITQYDMHAVEEAGLLKFDFLGIRNLAILEDAVRLAKKLHNIDLDLEKIPLDDPKTYQMLARGETMGVFQLNGSGMTRYLKELKPSSIHDINAMIALYRPGPMAIIDEYISRKKGKSRVIYYHPKMAKFLEKSYGLLVYQDDLLFTALELAGYDWESVDKFRKAIGKKIPEEMAKQHKIFVEGCKTHSQMTEKEAEKIWALFEPFQGYGFNKAHAASYGQVSYQTAYMKANFPIEYMASIMTAESGDVEKIAEAIRESEKMGIPVLPPNINESYGGFTIVEEGKKIRFGFYTIKNLGTDISDAIILERKKNGPFKSIGNFLERITHKNLNKKSLEALIKSGSFDEFEERGKLLFNLENLLLYNKEEAKKDQNQFSLFGTLSELEKPSLKLKDSDPISKEQRLFWEKELLGLYVSGHPLDKIKDKLESKGLSIKKIKEKGKENDDCLIAGIIESVRVVITKNNQKMAFIKLADLTDSIEAVIFARTLKEIEEIIKEDNCIVVSGKVSLRNGEKSIIIQKAKLI